MKDLLTDPPNIIKSQSLGPVVMPLVRVMADADLSWADREKVSAAVQACHRHWTEMEKERQYLGQQHSNEQVQPCGQKPRSADIQRGEQGLTPLRGGDPKRPGWETL